MPFNEEIVKLQRQRSVYLDFSQVNNAGVEWEGEVVRLYGIGPDDLGPYPIKGTVLSFGSFARSVLNMELDLEVPNVTIELVDDNNEWRVLAEPPSQQILYRWVHLMMRVLDDNGDYFDQLIGVGQITDPSFPAGKRVRLQLQLTGGDFLGGSVPRRLITMRDFPRCPPENVGKAVPIIYGVRSNQVRVAEITPGTPGSEEDACSGNILLSDTFESASPLSDTYSVNNSPTKTAGAGVGGSQGVVMNAGDAITAGPSFSGRTGCCSWDVNVGSGALLDMFTADGAQFVFSVGAGTGSGAPAGGINLIYNNLPSDITVNSAGGYWTEGTYFTLRVEWRISTYTGPTTADVEADGFLRVYVNNTLVCSAESVRVHGNSTAQTEIDQISFASSFGGGNVTIDNLVIREGAGEEEEEPVPAVCTPVDTGTGPNMTSGAVRCLLVDTGITTTVTVQNPAPEPGEFTIDTSIEQMGTAFANERIGSGFINVPTYFFVAPIIDGNVGPLSPIMDLDQGFDPDYPSHDAVISWNDLTTGTPDQWIVWMFTDSNFHPVSNPEPGARTRIINGTPYTDPDWPPGNTYDYQVVFTSVDDGDPWEPFPPLPGATTAFSGYRYLLAGHYLHRIAQVYVRRPVPVPAEEVDGDPTTVDMQVLQQEGTDFVQEVIEVNGNRYHTIRFFAAQQSDDCTTQYEVTANVEGIEDMADGTGALITEAFPMAEHLLLNWVFNDYRSSTGTYAPPGGRWFTDVPYSPGLLNHASFLAAQESSFLLTVGGYLGSGALTEPIETTQLVTDLMRSFGADFLYDPLIGWWVKLFDPSTIVRASLTEFDPHPPDDTVVGIISNSFDQRVERSVQNVVPYFAGPMTGRISDAGTDENGGYTVSGEVRDPDSIRIYGQTIAAPLYLNWTADPETAYSVVFRFLQHVRYPAIMAELRAPLSALLTPLGSEVAVTHPDGIGSVNGWSQRVCRIYRQTIDLDAMEVHLLLRDVDRLVP